MTLWWQQEREHPFLPHSSTHACNTNAARDILISYTQTGWAHHIDSWCLERLGLLHRLFLIPDIIPHFPGPRQPMRYHGTVTRVTTRMRFSNERSNRRHMQEKEWISCVCGEKREIQTERRKYKKTRRERQCADECVAYKDGSNGGLWFWCAPWGSNWARVNGRSGMQCSVMMHSVDEEKRKQNRAAYVSEKCEWMMTQRMEMEGT